MTKRFQCLSGDGSEFVVSCPILDGTPGAVNIATQYPLTVGLEQCWVALSSEQAREAARELMRLAEISDAAAQRSAEI